MGMTPAWWLPAANVVVLVLVLGTVIALVEWLS